jgi:hypothetical protein
MSISRITTFADLFQANSYVGRTTSNTFAPLNSVLTVIGARGAATFVNVTSTLSTAGYSGGDVVNLSTGISTILANQYALILALYNVTSTSFSTLFAELSSPSTIVSNDQFTTLSNSYVSTTNRAVIGTGAVTAGQILSNTPLQFTSSSVLGWNWFPIGDAGTGAISSIYASTPGLYEVTARINYTTAATDAGLLLQLRNAGGTVLDETISQLPSSASATASNAITFQTLQSLSNESVYMQISTLNAPTATVQTLSGIVGMKLIYDSNGIF